MMELDLNPSKHFWPRGNGGLADCCQNATVDADGVAMRSISLRGFQCEGANALGKSTPIERGLLVGQDQEFVLPSLSPENRSAMLDLVEGVAAVTALRQDQARALAAGLDQLNLGEIQAEIQEARKALKRRKRNL